MLGNDGPLRDLLLPAGASAVLDLGVVAYSNEVLGMLLRFFQTGYIRNYGLFILMGVLVLLYFFF